MSVKFLRSWGWAVCAISVAVIGLGCPISTPTVPDLVGLEEDAALAALEEIGLIADVYRIHDDVVAEDIVLSQDPAADTQVESGSTVTLGVSLGPCFVPDVIYDAVEDASAEIVAAGLIVGETELRFDPSAPANTVLETEPVAGTQIAVGSAVNLVVSKGPDPMVGLVNVPTYPVPVELAVDGLPMSQNADITVGAWHWFKFEGTAGTKYYVHVTGNAPVNAMVFIGTDVPGTDQQAAQMLWTTDADLTEYWEFIYDEICQECEDDCEYCPCAEEEDGGTKVAKSEKAIMIPNFVAPEDATYYVVVQAAKILTCWPECSQSDYLMAAYYDVRTFSVQVTTSTSYEDAVQIATFDPTTDAPFYRGAVKVNKHDWLSFNAEADANYMIEFMLTDLSFDYKVKATLYSPLGDVVVQCDGWRPDMDRCDRCAPEALYTPNAGTYYILVEVGDCDAPDGSGHYDGSDDLEFGEFPYILRVLSDDHGNAASLATTIATPDLNAEEVADGYLSRADNDWFNFNPGRFATYRIETRGEFDLALEDSFSYSFEDYDGKNDMAIIVNTNSTALRAFEVYMPDFENDPYWLQQGAYQVAIVGDDHVDPDIRNMAAAQAIEIGGTGTGIVWPKDQDMFSFDLAYNFMHKIVSTGAEGLEVKKLNASESGFDALTVASSVVGIEELKTITAYLNPFAAPNNIDEDTTGYIIAKGADAVTNPDQLDAAYTITVERGENPIFTGMVDPDAQSVAVGACLSGSLWPAENNVLKFTATKAYFLYQIALSGADTLAAYVADDEGVLNSISVSEGADGNFYLYLDEVDAGGTDVYLVVSLAAAEATDYEVCVAEDDFIGVAGVVLPGDADITELDEDGEEGVLWTDQDEDVFEFTAEAGKLYKVQATADSDALLLDADGTPGALITDTEYDYEVLVGPYAEETTVLVSVMNDGDEDIAYEIALVEDDHGNDAATATVMTNPTVGASAVDDGELWSVDDTDAFKFTAQAGTYRVQVLPMAPDGAVGTFTVDDDETGGTFNIGTSTAEFDTVADQVVVIAVDQTAGPDNAGMYQVTVFHVVPAP